MLRLSEQQKVAIARALIGALIAGGLTILTTWQGGADGVRVLLPSFLVPFLTVLAIRGGFEGAYDAARNRGGDG